MRGGMDETRDIPLMEGFAAPEREAWREAAEQAARRPLERLLARTDDGVPIAPLYTRADLPDAPDFAGFPGFAPELRGRRADDRPCRNLVRVTSPDPVAARAEACEALEGGADGLVLVLDDGRPEDEGADGVVLALGAEPQAAADALDVLLADVRLDRTPVVLEAGLRQRPAAEALLALFDRRRQQSAAGTNLGFDPLAWAARTGADGRAALDETLAWLQERALVAGSDPAVLRLSGRVWHDAGASEAEELAILAASLVEALRRGEAAGIAPEHLAARTDMHLMADADVLLSVAKLRAARAIMRRIADAARLPAGLRQLTAETAPRMFTRCDPWTNMLRATLAAQAALIAGAAGVSVRPYTDALGFADAHARRIARNVPLILMEESAIRQVIDAAGGSWAIEALTRALAERAWRLFREIEEGGGLAAAIAAGRIAEMIEETAARRRKEIATRRRPITGVSEYPNLDERLPQPPAGPTRAALRRQAGLQDPAPGARWAFGPVRLAAEFEAYRALSDRLLAEKGARPAIFLANIGPIARHNARATFAANAFAAGGIRPITNDGFTDAGTMAEAFRASGARLAVICGHDEDQAAEAAAFAAALKAAGAALVWLAGRPDAERAEAWRRAGVDRFIGLGSDMPAEYDAAIEALGIAPPRGRAGRD